jgi:hypothetical protein
MAEEAFVRLRRAPTITPHRKEDCTMRHLARPDTAKSSVAARAYRIRARLPGQLIPERLEMARLRYGELYPLDAIRRKVAETLPRRIGFVRGAAIEPIERYSEPIPDDVLLKYDDARRTGLFSTFWVVTPKYYEQRQYDPWVIAQVKGSELSAVIAQWDELTAT